MKYPLISKEEFCKYISILKKQDEKEDLITKAFRQVDEEADVAFISLYSSERAAILDLLNVVMDTEINPQIGSDIEYFCYDLDFGKVYESGKKDWIKDENDEIIDLSTAEKLYDYLVEEHFRHNKKKNRKQK